MPGRYQGRRNDRRQRGRNHSQEARPRGYFPTPEGHPFPVVEPQYHYQPDVHRPATFGVVIFDLETVHDAERGTYFEKGLHECASQDQWIWKSRSQIIQFGAVDLHNGNRLNVECRPKFTWDKVISPAARQFAEDHGHDQIVQNESLPHFLEPWQDKVVPFLVHAAGRSKQLALIAHNGENFDEMVLAEEDKRLGLFHHLRNAGITWFFFDPIKTLKNKYGQDYGTCGKLSLAVLYAEHVGEKKQQSHQALDDCLMLLEVLSKWEDLRDLLAQDISQRLCSVEEEARDAAKTLSVRFRCPAHNAVQGRPPPPPPLPPQQPPSVPPVMVDGPVRQPPPPPSTPAPENFDQEPRGAGELRLGAVEFVPGVLWTGGSQNVDIPGAHHNNGGLLYGQRSGEEGEVPYWEPVVGEGRRFQ